MILTEENKTLSSTQLTKSVWWRMTWRQTLFAGVITAVFYLIKGYDIYSSFLHPDSDWHTISEMIVALPFIIVLFSLFSIFILRQQVWKRKIAKNGNEYCVKFTGSKNSNKLTTIEATIIFIAILWRAWIINGIIMFLFWWIPGFFIVSYLIAKFIAIKWYSSYPLGKIKIDSCDCKHI